MTWRVIVGTLSFVVAMIVLGFVAVTEQDRMASFGAAYSSRQVEVGAAIFESNCALCHGLDGKGTGRGPSLNSPDLFTGQRLAEIGWAGSVDDYLRATIASGRPRASAAFTDFNYPERMPTWGQENGGPLRRDQIESLVAYIMNWGVAYANITPEPTPTVIPVGTDITIELPAGDAANGEQLVARNGCTACHVLTAQVTALIGPAWLAKDSPDGKGVGAHAEERFQNADYAAAAVTPEQYLFESIVSPSAYIVPPVADHASADGTSKMPAIYGATLDAQNVADIIAYLLTLK
jgi:mono/diheme cytochrome c family protein